MPRSSMRGLDMLFNETGRLQPTISKHRYTQGMSQDLLNPFWEALLAPLRVTVHAPHSLYTFNYRRSTPLCTRTTAKTSIALHHTARA